MKQLSSLSLSLINVSPSNNISAIKSWLRKAVKMASEFEKTVKLHRNLFGPMLTLSYLIRYYVDFLREIGLL